MRGDAKKKTEWAIQEMKDTARAAQKLGVKVVNGFTGSSIWHLLYSFPPVSDATIDEGFQLFADRWNPILDVFKECGVKFGLEVHPTEIAFDIYTAERALKAVNHRPEFGFNFDPSHLHWQMVDPVEFIRAFPDRIYHVHVKDAARTLDGRTGILASHLNFGDPRARLGFPLTRPRTGQFRGNRAGTQPHRLRGAAVGRMGRSAAWIANTGPPRQHDSSRKRWDSSQQDDSSIRPSPMRRRRREQQPANSRHLPAFDACVSIRTPLILGAKLIGPAWGDNSDDCQIGATHHFQVGVLRDSANWGASRTG